MRGRANPNSQPGGCLEVNRATQLMAFEAMRESPAPIFMRVCEAARLCVQREAQLARKFEVAHCQFPLANSQKLGTRNSKPKVTNGASHATSDEPCRGRVFSLAQKAS